MIRFRVMAVIVVDKYDGFAALISNSESHDHLCGGHDLDAN